MAMKISRRSFLASVAAGSFLGTVGFHDPLSGEVEDAKTPVIPVPSTAQKVWQDCELGILFHFDATIPARKFAPNNTYRKTIDPSLYNPQRLDTDQWLDAAKAAGAKYAIFTATHFNGFMQWQSDLYPYGLKQARWRNGRGDLVKDFVESCRKYDILPALYFSTHRNVYWEVWGHWVDWGKGRGTEKQAAFNRICEKMTEELCSRYGQLVQIWYDAGVKTPREGGPDVLPVFKRYQPDSVFYHSRQRADHRWIGNEAGHAGVPCWARVPSPSAQALGHRKGTPERDYLYYGDPDGSYWCPAMVDVPLRGSNGVHAWFWRPGEGKGVDSLEKLVRMYYQSVGRNCNFVIGAVIDPEGQVPEKDAARLAEFGREISRRFSNRVGETKGEGTELTLSFSAPQMVSQVVLMEKIEEGERVRRYKLLFKKEGGRWETISSGECIGHKRIETFDPVETTSIKLSIDESIAKPLIRRLAAYHV